MRFDAILPSERERDLNPVAGTWVRNLGTNASRQKGTTSRVASTLPELHLHTPVPHSKLPRGTSCVFRTVSKRTTQILILRWIPASDPPWQLQPLRSTSLEIYIGNVVKAAALVALCSASGEQALSNGPQGALPTHNKYLAALISSRNDHILSKCEVPRSMPNKPVAPSKPACLGIQDRVWWVATGCSLLLQATAEVKTPAQKTSLEVERRHVCSEVMTALMVLLSVRSPLSNTISLQACFFWNSGTGATAEAPAEPESA